MSVSVTITKPKSAPNPSTRTRKKSKWITSKSSTIKEIEDWAKDGNTRSHDMARSSGQLAENVTEQRLLQAKLWDLSKERYKFLSQNTYEKKAFLDKQKKKSQVFHDLLKDVIIDSQGRSKNLPSSLAERKRRNSNARLALLNRLDPNKGLNRPKEQRENQSTGSKEEVVRPHSLPAKADLYQETIPPAAPVFATEVQLKTETRLPQLNKETGRYTAGSVTFSPGNTKKGSPSFNTARRITTFNKWARKPSKKIEKEGPVTDPRYTNLEDTLSRTYTIPDHSPDIKTLISCSQALRLRGSRQSEPKPKITFMVNQFMQERGIVF